MLPFENGVFVCNNYKQLTTGSKVCSLSRFPPWCPILICSFVMCPLSPPRVIPGHFWMMQNPVEPGKTMTLLDRKSNEAWNQYVQSCRTRGMLGNGVSGALWSCFNHRDLGLSTRKQAGYCQNTTTPWDECCSVCASVMTFSIIKVNCASICPYLHETKA